MVWKLPNNNNKVVTLFRMWDLCSSDTAQKRRLRIGSASQIRMCDEGVHDTTSDTFFWPRHSCALGHAEDDATLLLDTLGHAREDKLGHTNQI
ncbi:hypothetical protein DEO72_LG2g3512 [Vigna unguiculata]|uniref:Uncharacterized protein n=1 Tax=Vigna unguiculata TaxID=3917 RepID=A0A4D6L3U4_VIGUN|nr:hypothetical protein DEO72_LG2g3512 [Vigna unguiculata]